MTEFRDRGRTRRILAAVALSIAIHEIIALCFPKGAPQPAPVRVVAQRVTLEHPTPSPPPPPPAPRITPKPVPEILPTHEPRVVVHRPGRRSGGRKTKRRGGRPAPSHALAAVIPRTVATAPARKPAAASGAGSGSGGGKGAESGGAAGSAPGQGSGSSGEGTGGDAAPCGEVDLIGFGQTKYVKGKFYEPVRATIHYRDGHSETEAFPYPFVYASEAEDPWSRENLKKSEAELGIVRVQLPPPGFDRATLGPVIAEILAHTDPSGIKTWDDCPNAPPLDERVRPAPPPGPSELPSLPP
jgi:hypothetical protein